MTASASPILAKEIGGIRFNDQVQQAGTPLVLNGGGVCTRLLFDIYAIALYLPQKTDSAEAVIEMVEPKRIQLVILRDVTVKQLTNAFEEGIAKNHTPDELVTLAPNIAIFRTLLASMGNRVGDGTEFHLDYSPVSHSTLVFVNGKRQNTEIPDDNFFRALLKIWLGEHSVQDSLKDELLGK